MKIVVLGGTGAMGSIYGSHLSLHHEVYLVGRKAELAEQINREGLILQEKGENVTYRPNAVTSTADIGCADLVLLFVKALASEDALTANRALIGPNTYLMTLQNGSGHEEILSKFVPMERIVIGTTEDNGKILSPGHVYHGGTGRTNIGMLAPDKNEFLPKLKAALDECGFDAKIHSNIQQLIWNKLFTNVSLSAVTGVLQVPMGYIAENEYAWALTTQLIQEAVAVAHALSLEANEEAILSKVRATALESPEGITSICADLRAGRKTEVNTISGSVVRAAKKVGVPAPTHECIVNLIHAMEQKT